MYIPRRYEEKDKEKIFAFIREHSFGILISVKEGLPVATHIPLLAGRDAAGRDVLSGHISKGNEQKYTLQEGAEVLAIFTGPHAYVSPGWYTQMNVPTWNYIAVHVYGRIHLLDEEELKASLSSLVDEYEHSLNRPVKMDEIPEKTLHDNLRGIIGFEILVTEIQAAYKLSQNRDEDSYHSVISHLETGDEAARGVAQEMKIRGHDLFGGGKIEPEE